MFKSFLYNIFLQLNLLFFKKIRSNHLQKYKTLIESLFIYNKK